MTHSSYVAPAAKYKEYNKGKTASVSVKHSVSSSSSTVPHSSSRAADVFKTPPKPRQKKQHVQTEDEKARDDLQMKDGAAGSSNGTETGTTYVIANSPSKLRTLAALHSRSGSPNKVGSANARSADLLGVRSSRQHENDESASQVNVVGSPKKYNPFASSSTSSSVTAPGSHHNSSARRSPSSLFGAELARQERQRADLRRNGHRHQGREDTSANEPWESIFAPGKKQAARPRTSQPILTSGPSAQAASSSSRLHATRSSASTTMDIDDADQSTISATAADIAPALGPSPVKPVAPGQKAFKPLFDTSAVTTKAPSLATIPTSTKAAKKLFESDISSLKRSTSGDGSGANSTGPNAARGTKRALAGVPGAMPFVTKAGNAFDRISGDEDENGAHDVGAHDSDSSDDSQAKTKVRKKRLDVNASSKKRGGAKKSDTTTTTTKRAGPGSGKSKNRMTGTRMDVDVEGLKGIRANRVHGQTLLVERDSDGEDAEEDRPLDKVVIYPRRPYWASRSQGRTTELDQDGIQMGQDEDADGTEEQDDVAVDTASLSVFYRHQTDLLSAQTATQAQQTPRQRRRQQRALDLSDRSPSSSPSNVNDQTNQSLPAELAAVLSLSSTSPIKKTLKRQQAEKAERVRKLLGEPSRAGRSTATSHESSKKKLGLLDLQEDEDLPGDQSKSGSECGDRDGAGEDEDDDWASDAEGWKDLGDGEMDNYAADEVW